MKLLRLLVPALALAEGCAGDVPSPTLVDDLRVLAIRAEPPELLVDRGSASALPVAFDALVVDPRGPSMTYEWRFCPVESSETCGDFDRRRGGAPVEFQAALDAARAERHGGQAAPGGGALGVDTFTVSVAESVFAYHLVSSGLGLGNGSWVSAVLHLQAGADTLLAQKRVVLNARDLSAWNPELARFGWQVCSAEPTPGCIPLAPRTANRNPGIAELQLARGASAEATFQPATSPITVAPGEIIRLRPVLDAGAEERYQTVESTLQGNNLVVVDRSEDPITSWFGTGGKFGNEQTTKQLTKTLDNTFTAPDAPGPISIYIVVRDQRGGVGWTSLDVLVQ